MNKKLMSVIAAAAVIVSGSPLCANAIYTERMTPIDHTDYLKIDFMSDENKAFYIYTGEKYQEEPYYHRILVEKYHSDRIYLTIHDNLDPRQKDNVLSADNETTKKINALLEGFKTANGNNVKACINGFSDELGYYITPYDNDDPYKILKLTSNDARRIKDILAKNNIAEEMVYSTDVNSPNNGYTVLTLLNYSSEVYTERCNGKTPEERQAVYDELKAEAVTALEKYIKDNDLDFTLETSDTSHYVSLKPNYEISFEDHLAVIKDIHDKTNIGLGLVAIEEAAAAGEKFGGIDLMNAVDGDSNCDEQMDMADVVFVMQSLANPNKYQLSEQGSFNADFDGNGITVGDAQAIQNKLLNLN